MDTAVTTRPFNVSRFIVKSGTVVNVIGPDPMTATMTVIETGVRGRMIRLRVPNHWLEAHVPARTHTCGDDRGAGGRACGACLAEPVE